MKSRRELVATWRWWKREAVSRCCWRVSEAHPQLKSKASLIMKVRWGSEYTVLVGYLMTSVRDDNKRSIENNMKNVERVNSTFLRFCSQCRGSNCTWKVFCSQYEKTQSIVVCVLLIEWAIWASQNWPRKRDNSVWWEELLTFLK